MYASRNVLNQMYWRAAAYSTIGLLETKGPKAWIADKARYWRSAGEVIGKAVADRITGENEFKDKRGLDAVITFKAKPERYERRHWNAVALYNYIHLYNYYDSKNEIEVVRLKNKKCKCIRVKPKSSERHNRATDIFVILEDKLQKYYNEYYRKNGLENKLSELQSYIRKAISDIRRYDSALALSDIMKEMFECAEEYEKTKPSENNLQSSKMLYLCPGINEGSINGSLLFPNELQLRRKDQNEYLYKFTVGWTGNQFRILQVHPARMEWQTENCLGHADRSCIVRDLPAVRVNAIDDDLKQEIKNCFGSLIGSIEQDSVDDVLIAEN